MAAVFLICCDLDRRPPPFRLQRATQAFVFQLFGASSETIGMTHTPITPARLLLDLERRPFARFRHLLDVMKAASCNSQTMHSRTLSSHGCSTSGRSPLPARARGPGPARAVQNASSANLERDWRKAKPIKGKAYPADGNVGTAMQRCGEDWVWRGGDGGSRLQMVAHIPQRSFAAAAGSVTRITLPTSKMPALSWDQVRSTNGVL